MSPISPPCASSCTAPCAVPPPGHRTRHPAPSPAQPPAKALAVSNACYNSQSSGWAHFVSLSCWLPSCKIGASHVPLSHPLRSRASHWWTYHQHGAGSGLAQAWFLSSGYACAVSAVGRREQRSTFSQACRCSCAGHFLRWRSQKAALSTMAGSMAKRSLSRFSPCRSGSRSMCAEIAKRVGETSSHHLVRCALS